MRYPVVLCLALLCSVSIGSATQEKQRQKRRCTIVPSDQAVLAVAVQRDSPLAFEDVALLSCFADRGGNSYRLRNRGAKSIRRFTVAALNSNGSGNKFGWGAATPEEVVMPGQLVPIKEEDVELVPLTKEVREKLNLEGSTKIVTIFMVIDVEYADGTRYTDQTAFNALEDYFELMGANH